VINLVEVDFSMAYLGFIPSFPPVALTGLLSRLRNLFEKAGSNKKTHDSSLCPVGEAAIFLNSPWRKLMQLTISGHHLHVTSAIERYLVKRLRKLERHHHPIVDGQVTLSVDQDRQHAEGRIFCSGFNLFAQSTHRNLYAAIDAMADKLDRQVLDHKKKVKARRHQSVPLHDPA
jgi:putative sigma-54 modulation protein